MDEIKAICEKHGALLVEDAALRAIGKRERVFLLYRYGFDDEVEHPLTETAQHFSLSENRARLTEKSAMKNVRREFFKFSGIGKTKKSGIGYLLA